MTVVSSTANQLLQVQFGVNEIASAITVGNYVGSVFTRTHDAKIYDVLAKQYSLFVRTLPPHLRTVDFNRTGTVLGANQRSMNLKNTFGAVEITSLEGLATFLILLLRLVETKADILVYVKQLLKGKFGLVHGGKLSDLDEEKVSLPFSMKPLQSHINAVLDADRNSTKYADWVNWMAELYTIVGPGVDLMKASQYSHRNFRRFIEALFGGQLRGSTGDPSGAQCRFDTLSLGTAAMCLAALSNGANVTLAVVRGDGKIMVPERRPRITTERPFEVFLWLTEPPEGVASIINRGSKRNSREDSMQRSLPIFGGDAELSQLVACDITCDLPPDEILVLWRKALDNGGDAEWESCSRNNYITAFNIRLSTSFLQTEIDANLEPLSKTFYSGPRSDRTHLLARKIAVIYHEVYQSRNYSSMDPMRRSQAIKAMELIAGAFAVGCIKSLISNSSEGLSVFAWTLYTDGARSDSGRYNKLAEMLVNGGVSLPEILVLVGKIWGGLDSSSRLDPEFSGTGQSLGGQVPVMGIVCPHKTVLLNILHDPRLIAEHVCAKGLVSVFAGSNPLLPQDPLGYIWASELSSHQNLIPDTLPSIVALEDRWIFTTEPFIENNGRLCVVLCAWNSGDVVFQLNPAEVLSNLIRCRSLRVARIEVRQDSFEKKTGFRTITRDDVYSGLKLLAPMPDMISVVESNKNIEFQIICAGHFSYSKALLIFDEAEADEIRQKRVSAQDISSFDVVIIGCKES